MPIPKITKRQRYAGTRKSGDESTPVIAEDLNNLIDAINELYPATNIRTLSYTIGVAGVTGVDYNFTSVANTTEQSIQLGATTIIPENSLIVTMVVTCQDGLNGAITGTSDVGSASGGTQYMTSANIDDTGEAVSTLNTFYVSSSASSVYFSFTPSANWDTITTGKWKIWITYIDNSIV